MLCVSEIRIIPDWTILIEIAVFLFVLIVLNLLVMRPMLRIIDKRREFTTDASEEAGKLSADASQLDDGRHEVLTMALREAQKERDERTFEALREADRIKAEAISRMDKMTSSSEISIETGDRSIVEELNERSQELAREIVERIEG